MKSNPSRRVARITLELVASVLLVFVVGCVGLDGAPCPCAEDHSCFEPTNTCLPTISYPTDGNRSNFLAQSHTIFRSDEQLGFVANLPPATELVVRITLAVDEGATDAWYFSALDSQDWQISQWDGGPQEFAADHDGLVDLDGFHFKGTGSAVVQYFEHGAATPTASKIVHWAP